MNRMMISATGSNTGKTTFTIGLIEALKRRGLTLCAFKSGPDYIDPMFHKKALGISSYNLDLFLMGEEYVRYSLRKHTMGKDVAIIEGAMGFYDGIADIPDAGAWDLSQKTETPVVLVVRGDGMGASLAALVHGYQTFRPNHIIGVVINQGNPMLQKYYEDILKQHCGLPLFGILPKIEGAEISSRHLGLTTAPEITDLQEKIVLVADVVEKYVDIDGLLRASEREESIPVSFMPPVASKVRMGVALDEAFCFYYEDTFEEMEARGVEWVPVSLLHDEKLPENLDGFYIGGGYPELYLKEIGENLSLLQELKDFYQQDKVFLAECGGFMVLLDRFEGKESCRFMGLLPGKVELTHRLQNFGYHFLTATEDNLLCGKGEVLRGHEFHYSKSTNSGTLFDAQKPRSYRTHQVGHGSSYTYMGYPHIHLASNPQAMERIIKKMKEVRSEI